MGLREDLSTVAVATGSSTLPQTMRDGIDSAGMGPTSAFSPGEPMQPFDGYSTPPRQYDFQTGYNIAARPKHNERIAFETLRALIEAYDVAQMCIWHRIESLRSLDWDLIAKPGHCGDVTDAVNYGREILETPDGQTEWLPWFSKWAYDTLAYDAGTLYRQRNNANQVIGLQTVDGTTIAPLLDDWGRTPSGGAPAYVQYANGVPWSWLTTDDLIYAPLRTKASSPYGVAPLETILLNANTDLRFQAYFMQRFTAGNIPEAFATAPDDWTPDQIKQFQAAWDALMMGDQKRKNQIRWIPGGTGISWSNDKTFDNDLSLFILRKTCGAYHIPPSEFGFTADVNRATAETQDDLGFRVGDKPLIKHFQSVLSRFIQKDLGLPLVFRFDTGKETEDRLQTAQSDQIYVNMGAVSVSEVREERFGLTEPGGAQIPRFIFDTRSGPIPIASLEAVSGPVDPESGVPEPGADLPQKAFTGVPGVVTNPPPTIPPLAVTEFGPDAAPTPYVAPAQQVAKAAVDELAQFDRFRGTRRARGSWRDFRFTTLDTVQAHRLNDAARAEIRKAAGELIAAGLAVRAADTGRVLMLQRGLDPTDPASGLWEFPGGHIEDGEQPLDAAWREWQEETGCLIPPGTTVGDSWASSNGIYQGFIASVPSETSIDIRGRGQVLNPDDPDGDIVEAIAWWEPNLLSGNPAIRPELAADLVACLEALAGYADVAKAGDPDPKGTWRDGPADTPHARADLPLTDAYAPRIARATQALWTIDELTKAASGQPLTEADAAQLTEVIRELVVDAFQAGTQAALEQLGEADDAFWSAWEPGHVPAALLTADGEFANLLADAGVTIAGISDTATRLVGDKIADGLLNGDSVATIARTLRTVLGDPKRAERIAHTETARAMSTASMQSYTANGIDEWDLITSAGACPTCDAIAAANPHPVSDGADQPPVHPLCRCAPSPHVNA